MQFLKTLLWIAIAVLVALFAIRNGTPVTVNLWSDLQMVTPLWVIVLLSFLVGLLPVLAMHRASKWRWRRRLEQSDRALTESRNSTAQAAVPTADAQSGTRSETIFGDTVIPPAATPIAPPPAGT